MSEENIEIALRMLEYANRRDVAGILALMAPEIECFPAAHQPESQPFRGRDAFAEYVDGWLNSFEKYAIEPIESLDLGEYVVVVGRIAARGRGSGVEISEDDAWLYRFRDGQAIEYHECGTKQRALETAGIRP